MNLPSSLAHREPSSKDIELYSLPVIRRVSSKSSAKSVASRHGSLKRQGDHHRRDKAAAAPDNPGGLSGSSASRIPEPGQHEHGRTQSDNDVKRSYDGALTPAYDERDPLSLAPNLSAGARTASSRSRSLGSSDGDDGDDDGGDTTRVGRAWQSTKRVLRRHCAFIGPGIIASVGYTDPGNWVTDLAAGSQFGYKLLFIVLVSGLFGIFLQILAVRMGVVTGVDLARNTRLLLLPDDDDRVRGRIIGRRSTVTPDRLRFRVARIITLWGLYLVSEAALIATELAELLGSAIALNLLFPGLPLWGGVLVTSADVMLFLFVYQPQGNFRYFELLIAALVLIVLACYVVLLVRVDPDWGEVFYGYVPSSTLVKADALYTGVGIIGAVIMPHALYLGSHFSTINRLDRSKNKYLYDDDTNSDVSQQAPWHERWSSSVRRQIALRFPRVDAHLRDRRSNARNVTEQRRPSLPRPSQQQQQQLGGTHIMTTSSALAAITSPVSPGKTIPGDVGQKGVAHVTPRMSIAEIKLHLPHAAWDIALSLFFFAITVNSAILIVAGAAFFFGGNQTPEAAPQVSDLYDAYNLLCDTLGKPYAILFAIALLAAGQSASITCTLAGQLVSEGFIKWRTNAFLRRLITRVITVIPSIAIAVGVGRNGLDEMLVASQVALAFALPFVLVPLIAVTSMHSKMRLEDDVDEEAGEAETTPAPSLPPIIATTSDDVIVPTTPPAAADNEGASAPAVDAHPPLPSPRTIVHDFTNKWAVKAFAAVVYLVICVADLYTLVTTIRGD